MKKTVLYLLFFAPLVCFAQLFPKIADFRGNIDLVKERRYGKEISTAKRDSGIFKPRFFSGWEYIYQFNEKSELVNKRRILNSRVNTEYLYEKVRTGDILAERETVLVSQIDRKGDYIECENFINKEGQIEKVNFWSFDAETNTRELYQVEKDAAYNNGKLVSFTRHNIKENGDLDTGEKVDLFYDFSGRLIRIERKDISTNLKTILYCYYDKRGFINRLSIDYLVGLLDYQNNKKQDIGFDNDRQGNWQKKFYWISEKKKRMEAKRRIIYR